MLWLDCSVPAPRYRRPLSLPTISISAFRRAGWARRLCQWRHFVCNCGQLAWSRRRHGLWRARLAAGRGGGRRPCGSYGGAALLGRGQGARPPYTSSGASTRACCRLARCCSTRVSRGAVTSRPGVRYLLSNHRWVHSSHRHPSAQLLTAGRLAMAPPDMPAGTALARSTSARYSKHAWHPPPRPVTSAPAYAPDSLKGVSLRRSGRLDCALWRIAAQ